MCEFITVIFTDWEKIMYEKGAPNRLMLNLNQVTAPLTWYRNEQDKIDAENAMLSVVNLSLDHTSYMLLCLISFFDTTNQKHLEEPQVVAQIQHHFMSLLHKHLGDRMGKNFVEPAFTNYMKTVELIVRLEKLRL